MLSLQQKQTGENSPLKRGIAAVLLPFNFAGILSYKIPETLSVSTGDYVRVPLGKKEVVGVVWGEGTPLPQGKPLKCILERYPFPALPETIRRFILWVAHYYGEVPGTVLAMYLRAPGIFKNAPGENGYSLSQNFFPADFPKGTQQQKHIVSLLLKTPFLTFSELCQTEKISRSVVSSLIKKGILEKKTRERWPPLQHGALDEKTVTLTPEQQEAVCLMLAHLTSEKSPVFLLDGVTGSGKTEVFFEAIAHTLREKKQVLLLVPEISLTLSLKQRAENRFGIQPALWHSDLSEKERSSIWKGVTLGTVQIVLGARSALFLPWRNLGMIVVDEEHEQSFKQMEAVPYHGRDMAVTFGKISNIPVILASATPSLETLANVERGRYLLITLKTRYGEKTKLPEIKFIDMRLCALPKGNVLSPELRENLTATLQAGNQVLLFLNRRGYAPLTLCRACGNRIECPNCSVSLIEHRSKGLWICHHCGFQKSYLSSCPSCHEEKTLIPCGVGIERLEEEVNGLFPGNKTIVLSSDTRTSKTLGYTLEEIRKGEYSIILGTQLLAKGHHFPNLTLVGIIDADCTLKSADLRAGERTWQTLVQVSGRAGRGNKSGTVFIQSYMPEHPLMQAFLHMDRQAFICYEKNNRKAAGMPPYERLAAVIVSSKKPEEAQEMAYRLKRAIPTYDDILFLGPAPAPLALRDQWHRWRFLLKAPLTSDLTRCALEWIASLQKPTSVKIELDVDPYYFL